MAEDERKAALIDELASARSHLTKNVDALRHDLDVTTRLRRSFARHPAIWIGGTTLFGLLLSRLLFGKKKTVTNRQAPEPGLEKAGKAGLVLAALKFAFDLARPILIPWAKRRFTEYFSPEKNGESPPR